MLNLINRYFRRADRRVVVLMYHRVCNPETDPWQLSVSPDHFDQQIRTIKQHFNVIPMGDFLHQMDKKKFEKNSVIITFDDGYADNYVYAKPILEKYACPATFFIATHFTGKQTPFWWDVLESVILHSPVIPGKLLIELDSAPFEFDLEMQPLTSEMYEKHKNWKWSDNPPTKRCELYLQLWQRLQPLPFNEIEKSMLVIKRWAGYSAESARDSPMDSNQLTDLSDHSLFTLGVHTSTHPALDNHPPDVQLEEISTSKQLLEKQYGKEINVISYPYGRLNGITINIVSALKFSAGFTTTEKVAGKNSYPLTLGRFQVNNYSGDQLKKQIDNWFAR